MHNGDIEVTTDHAYGGHCKVMAKCHYPEDWQKRESQSKQGASTKGLNSLPPQFSCLGFLLNTIV